MSIKRRRNREASSSIVVRMPRWSLMILDSTAAQFGITKSDLLRGVLERLETKDELLDARQVLKSSSYLSELVQFHFYLSDRALFLLENAGKTLQLGYGQLLACLLLNFIDEESQRLQENRPRVRQLSALRHRQIYLAEELVDALYSVRDDRGESLSLLLQEAVLDYRERKLKRLPILRKDRNVNLRLTSQQWSKLDTIAASSEMDTTEAVAALFLHHYFSGDLNAKTTYRDQEGIK